MAVDDQGIEVLKKAGERVVAGNNSDYFLKTKLLGADNSSVNFKTNDSNQLLVVLDGKVDSTNSTKTLLSAGEEFTGEGCDTLDYAIIYVSVFSDVVSATDGLCIDGSSDNITWYQSDCYSVAANVDKTFSFQPNRKFFRVRYKNGATPQTNFNLETIFKKTNSKPSSHRIQDDIVNDDDAELVKAVITGETPSGRFTNFQSTRQGNFRVAIEEYGDTPAIDAFARLRVSTPFTIFDSKQLHDKQPLFWDELIGGNATSTHVSVDSDVEMTVTANANDFVIRQSKQRFNYQPGKSQLIFFTFKAQHVEGITNQIGIFDGQGTNYLTPSNGIFFECDGSISWNICKNGVITQSVTQENWNFDKFDGTGFSGETFDPDALQIGIIDYEWLGVGRVRVGFILNGLIRYCHYFNHSNSSLFSSVYMSTPNLPLRYVIKTDGTNPSTLKHICSSVISEGGIEENGILRSVSNGITAVATPSSGSTYAILAIRLKDLYKDITVLPEFFSMINTTSTDFRWSLQLNPTLSAALSYNDLSNSSIRYAVGTGQTITAENVVIDSGYVYSEGLGSNAGSTEGRKFETSLRMGSTIAGVTDQIVLCVTPLESAGSFRASLTFRELL